MFKRTAICLIDAATAALPLRLLALRRVMFVIQIWQHRLELYLGGLAPRRG
jgi:hypothetical protein